MKGIGKIKKKIVRGEMTNVEVRIKERQSQSSNGDIKA
jgi:hypothetical protein